MKKKTYRLTPEEKQKIMEQLSLIIGGREEIVFAYVYGSFTENIPFHDIDVGVYISETEVRFASHYAVELSGELEKRCKLPVDARILNDAPVSFLYHVLRGKLIFDRDEDRRVKLVEETVRRYLDIKPIIARAIREAFAA